MGWVLVREPLFAKDGGVFEVYFVLAEAKTKPDSFTSPWLKCYIISIRVKADVKMRRIVRYTIFETGWGYFGLAVRDGVIVRTCLSIREKEKARANLLAGFDEAECDDGILRQVQEKIVAYFEGGCVDFGKDIRIELGGLSDFHKRVITACRGVGLGRRVSYSQLAKRAGRAGAARAVGAVMAGNPVPLIVPCHRVIKSDGGIGGFSATGGIELKKRLLEHEKVIIQRGEQ